MARAAEVVTVDGFTVVKYRIGNSDSDTFVHAVYEPSPSSNRPWSHSTITSAKDFGGAGGFVGRLGTRDLPDELNTMPRGVERLAAVQRFAVAQYEQAYALILRAFPNAGDGDRRAGEITTCEPQPARIMWTGNERIS